MSLDSAIEFPPAPKLFTPDDLHEDDSHTKPRLSVDSDDSGIQFREYDSPDVVSEPRHHRSHLHHLHLPHHHSRHHSRHRPKKKRDSFERPPSSRSGETEAFASVIAYAERKRRRREAVARNILQLEERRKKDEASNAVFLSECRKHASDAAHGIGVSMSSTQETMTSLNNALSDLRSLATNAQRLRNSLVKDVANFDREVQEKLRAVNSFAPHKARLDELESSMRSNQRRMAELNRRLARSTNMVMDWRKRQEALGASITYAVRIMLISMMVFLGLMVIVYHTHLDGSCTFGLASMASMSKRADSGK